jgi:copper chaperone CopZ
MEVTPGEVIQLEVLKELLDTYEITLRNLSCEHCVQLIEQTLYAIPGMKSVQVMVAKQAALVTFNTQKTSISEILNALDEAGYHPKEHRPVGTF